MEIYIKQWRDGSATIMTGNGQVLWTLGSVAKAEQVCRDWLNVDPAGEDPDDGGDTDTDSSAAGCLAG